MREVFSDVVHWGSTRIPFRYSYTKRKTLAISVHPDLSVTVKAPEEISLEAIREKIRKRAPWIRRMWREFELYLPKQPSRRYINGETHRYLGRQYRLKVVQGEIETVKCLRGYLFVTTKEEPKSTQIECLLDRWYRDHAKQIFAERLRICVKKIVGKEATPPTLIIRKMTTRWGSCSKSSCLILNLELIKAPKDCIDYVIVHELCHLQERHHGPRFWRLLKRIVPDYKDVRNHLNSLADR